MSTSEVPPPQVKLSSPTLTSQFSIKMFLPLTSQASVLWPGLTGSVEGLARMVTPRTVTFGELAADGDVKHRRVGKRDVFDQNAVAATTARSCAGGCAPLTFANGHQGMPWPSIMPEPLMATSCSSRAADEIRRGVRAAGIFVQRQHPQHRAGVQVQIDVAGQLDRAAQKDARRHFDGSAAGGGCGIDGGLNGRGVGRHAIAGRAVVRDVETSIGNGRQRRD